jgi:hypothetical protein
MPCLISPLSVDLTPKYDSVTVALWQRERTSQPMKGTAHTQSQQLDYGRLDRCYLSAGERTSKLCRCGWLVRSRRAFGARQEVLECPRVVAKNGPLADAESASTLDEDDVS